MKKLVSLLLAALMLLGMATAALAEDAPETVTIASLNAEREPVELEVPYDPQRIAILDMPSLDILDRLGLGDRVVGSATTTLEYLQAYAPGDTIANLGTIKEADLEAVMACEPDVIFIGGRLSASYDALSEIAPVVFLSTDTEIGVVESVRNNATTIASMFGLEAQVERTDGRLRRAHRGARGLRRGQERHRRPVYQRQLQHPRQRRPLFHHQRGDRL